MQHKTQALSPWFCLLFVQSLSPSSPPLHCHMFVRGEGGKSNSLTAVECNYSSMSLQLCFEDGSPLSMVCNLLCKSDRQSFSCLFLLHLSSLSPSCHSPPPFTSQGEQLCWLLKLQVFCAIPLLHHVAVCVVCCYWQLRLL